MINPSKDFWGGKKVVITGGAGFCGSHVASQLVEVGASVRILDNLERGSIKNLSSFRSKVELFTVDCSEIEKSAYYMVGADIVINMAAKVTSIDYNSVHHAEMFQKNMMLQSAPLEAARLAGIKRFLQCSTVCVYPHNQLIPTPEIVAEVNNPEETNAGYGFAKLMGEKLARWYSVEYGMEIGITRFANLYGPRDYYDWETSHVIPALIRKCKEKERIEIWGNGEQRREFLYVEDAARGIILVTEKYAVADPVNIGPGFNVSINELCDTIQNILGTRKEIYHTFSKPTGHVERLVDNSKMMDVIGWVPDTQLREGLEKTIESYT